MGTVMALVLAIAFEVGIPPYFALAVAMEESGLDPEAYNDKNTDGSNDKGIMQLNSNYFGHLDRGDVETNIRAGCLHIRWLSTQPGVNTWWAVAVCYNAGYGRLDNASSDTLDYAERVMARYIEMSGPYPEIVIPYNR